MKHKELLRIISDYTGARVAEAVARAEGEVSRELLTELEQKITDTSKSVRDALIAYRSEAVRLSKSKPQIGKLKDTEHDDSSFEAELKALRGALNDDEILTLTQEKGVVEVQLTSQREHHTITTLWADGWDFKKFLRAHRLLIRMVKIGLLTIND